MGSSAFISRKSHNNRISALNYDRLWLRIRVFVNLANLESSFIWLILTEINSVSIYNDYICIVSIYLENVKIV